MGHPRFLPMGLRLIWLLWMSAGCLRIGAGSPPTPSPQPQTAKPSVSYPTPPPSATSTPTPSPTPTADLSSELGESLFRDDFSADLGWGIGESLTGSASLFDGKMVIAANKPGMVVFVLAPTRETRNVYAEVSMRTDLCQDGDEFGLMFRVSPSLNHYRFTQTCEGLARVSRFLGGSESALVPLTQTFAARPGAPADNRIAVWAQGGHFRFFINNLEVFDVRDFELPAGGFGLLVWSRKSGHTTVSFDEFTLRTIRPERTPPPDDGSP